jgi:uncharacterized protein (TIGR03000 family)
MFTYGGPLLLAGAIALVTPGFSQARGGGGGHGGGGHGGGGAGGGGHFSGGAGHFGSGGHYGGWHGGNRHAYGHYHHNFNGYGYYPYGAYGGYDYPYDNYDTYSYPTYGSGDSGEVAPDFRYGADHATPPATGQPDTTAEVTVNVPADARVWFDGTPTTLTGPVRHFRSPPLTPGSRYNYDVRVSWSKDGHDVIRTQQVEVTAGGRASVTFPGPAKAAAQVPAVKKG